MRRLIVSTYATLDGRVDDLREWAPPYDDEAVAGYHDELLAHSDGLVLGRRTYEIFAAIWPARAGGVRYADKVNSMPKHVVSSTLTDLAWENSHLLTGDAVPAVTALKQGPGQDLVVYGGEDLVRTLLEHDLVDEYRVMVVPVLLGKGRHLFDDAARRVDLALADTAVMPSGVAVLTYRPAR